MLTSFERLELVRALSGAIPSEKALAILGNPKYKEIVRELRLYARTSGVSAMTDAELVKNLSRYYGFASDEEPGPFIIKNPDLLVVGKIYALASNGLPLGAYNGSMMGPSHPGSSCGCDGTDVLYNFATGNRGAALFECGVYPT